MNSSSSTTKFTSPEFQNLFTAEFQTLINLFAKYGYEMRIAGGAVRDLLTGKMPHDVDFATTATPQDMIEMFEKENVRMINNNGEKHGTVTCRINDKENFEVTTLRVDIRTDGRHAEVEFTKDWIKDAERRDLTINSMFLGFDGTLYDYFGGRKDLIEKRLRFVGTASKRIQEDYLRILRYFRFFGRISDRPDGHEAETLAAIKDNALGLSGIAGERIWVELKKIATGKHASSLFKVMNDTNVLSTIGFTGELRFGVLDEVWHRCQDLEPLPMTIISSLFSTEDQVNELHKRVKMSKDELQLGLFILAHRHDEIFANISNKTKDQTILHLEKQTSNACGESREAKKLKRDDVDEIQRREIESERDQNLPLEGEQKLESCDSDILKRSLHHCQDLLVDTTMPVNKTRVKIIELLKYSNMRDTLELFQQWTLPRFPVSGIKLIEVGVPKGPIFSRELNRLKDIWRQSRFEKTEEELLQYLKKYDKSEVKSEG